MNETDKQNARDCLAKYGNVLIKDGRVLNTVELEEVMKDIFLTKEEHDANQEHDAIKNGDYD